ncbi:MAG TPA: hypothetical protein VJY63_09765 [Marinospirillum sp.]|uniref:hypothetical protein n=1 Tax=Marinospirillum sp. TaxID=2183934 RepID=UPI002B48BB8D|nr:hypothetical protein [Marinospirillum sp.]HKM16187.1 hypothetical protein [Marinospirillum sp.]
MLGKLLVTLIVGGIIYFSWRNQQNKNNTTVEQEKNRCLPAPYDQVKPPIKLIFSVALGVIILVTIAWMVYDWKDQRTLLEVQIITSTSAGNHYIGTYQVYKKDLQERGFITKDGQIVRIASNERLEVRQLDAN